MYDSYRGSLFRGLVVATLPSLLVWMMIFMACSAVIPVYLKAGMITLMAVFVPGPYLFLLSQL